MIELSLQPTSHPRRWGRGERSELKGSNLLITWLVPSPILRYLGGFLKAASLTEQKTFLGLLTYELSRVLGIYARNADVNKIYFLS